MSENKQKIEKLSTQITVEDAIVKSSIQIFTTDLDNPMPSGFGSGFILVYKERMFLVTVFHVIRGEQFKIYLETDQLSENGPVLKPVGGFCHFEKIKLNEDTDPEDLIGMLENSGEHLDIAFAEVHFPFNLLQQEIDFGYFKVDKGTKIFIGMENAVAPNRDQSYGFYGKIQQNVRGKLLYSRPTFKHGLKYHRTDGQFYIFLVPEKAIVSEEYEGCSGAPILDWEGNIVAVACRAKGGTKIVRGFSILECKKLLDLALESDLF